MYLGKSDWKLILETINLTKRLGKVTAMDSITFDVLEDQIFAHANRTKKKQV